MSGRVTRRVQGKANRGSRVLFTTETQRRRQAPPSLNHQRHEGPRRFHSQDPTRNSVSFVVGSGFSSVTLCAYVVSFSINHYGRAVGSPVLCSRIWKTRKSCMARTASG